MANQNEKENGQLAYETYCKAVGGVSFNEDKLPLWCELVAASKKGEESAIRIVNGWRTAAEAVAYRVRYSSRGGQVTAERKDQA